MNKVEFLLELTERLSPLPWEEVEQSWNYYSEMIDDRMEEGLSEEAAVAELGSVEEIAAQILSDVPLTRLVKERMKPKKRLSGGTVVLLVLGSPVWLTLLIAAFAVLLSLYAVLWAVIVVFWAVFVSFVACTLGGIAGGIVFAVVGGVLPGAALIGAGIVCAGLSVFLFFGCKAASKGTLWLTKKIMLGIKRCFVGKGRTA